MASRILLIIGGGIAAYKSCELVRLLKGAGHDVTCVITKGGQQFVTPMTLAALSGNQVYTDLFDLKDEAEMGHIALSRAADLLVVAPATADLMAKMAGGFADDLASTLLLATDKRVLAAPAMNVRMWEHAATQRNAQWLLDNGISFVGPDEGEMACGEYGPGRMAEPSAIAAAIDAMLGGEKPLKGKHILITAGPTHEPIDPVRYIANRSSGKQGFALAEAAAKAGAKVTLIAGPVHLPAPAGVTRIDVETALEMAAAVAAALPADAAIMAAAVADWRTESFTDQKIKKQILKEGGGGPPALSLTENPDILAGLCASDNRPALVVGFAAETENIIAHAKAKLERKGANIIIANDVSGDVMGGTHNQVHIITKAGTESLAEMDKHEAARHIIARVAKELEA